MTMHIIQLTVFFFFLILLVKAMYLFAKPKQLSWAWKEYLNQQNYVYIQTT